MKKKFHCPCCGHTQIIYRHTINIGLVEAFCQLVEYYKRSNKRANLQRDLTLTKNQYNNFQKLQYFKIVERSSDGRMPTRSGFDFYDGRSKINDSVATLGKEILNYDHDYRKESFKKPKSVGIRDIDERFYQKKENYLRAYPLF